ncbi:MAG: glycosyltransferase [Anaerolineales bacterium]|nr:MAG: glycosyltransferase [Anaerolineales bacterium]
MKIICFPHFYYLSEVSRLVEMGQALRRLGQEVVFFSHGGGYEFVAREAGFEVVAVAPTMSPERAAEYMAFNRGEKGNPFRESFFTDDELAAYIAAEADAFCQARADSVLIGWNLPSYLSAPLAGIPILVQQPGPFTAPFFDRKMGVFQPSLFGAARRLPLNWLVNWWLPRTKIWLGTFNRMAESLGLPQWKSTLDLMAGDLTLVMDAPEILGIPADELNAYRPRHPRFFHRSPVYRYGGPCFARLPGDVPEAIRAHFDTPRPKLYCAMGVSGSPRVLGEVVEIADELEIQSVIATTTVLPGRDGNASGRVLLTPHVPAHLVNPLADIAITHGGAGTVQTAIHSGTPLVGIPMHLEQTGNLSLVTRQGAGLMLSKWDLNRRSLARALERLLADASLRENMLRLKALQDKVDGSAIAAREIVNFFGASRSRMEQIK